MMTMFSIPKPFRGHTGIIQRNAIKSWLQLGRDIEVILFGDEPGMAEVAADFGIKQECQIARTIYGTPLLSSAFSRAESIARHDLVCYVNADIIFLSDFAEVVQRIGVGHHMLVGRRWDLDFEEPIDFGTPDWEVQLRAAVAAKGVLASYIGIDYFVFPKGIGLGDLPPFAVGRAGWDNWMILNALRSGCRVLDLTAVTTVVHQNHDYQHVPERRGETWQDSPESQANRALAGDGVLFSLLNATHQVTEKGVRRVFHWQGVRLCLQRSAMLHPKFTPLLQGAYRLTDSILRWKAHRAQKL